MFVFVHKTSARYLFFPGNFLIDGKQKFIGEVRGWPKIASNLVKTATVKSTANSEKSCVKALDSSRFPFEKVIGRIQNCRRIEFSRHEFPKL